MEYQLFILRLAEFNYRCNTRKVEDGSRKKTTINKSIEKRLTYKG